MHCTGYPLNRLNRTRYSWLRMIENLNSIQSMCNMQKATIISIGINGIVAEKITLELESVTHDRDVSVRPQ